MVADWVCVCHTLYDSHRCSRRPPPALSLQKVLHFQETNNNLVFLIWLHFYNPHLIPMSSPILLEFTYNFGGLMQRRRNSMVNTLKSCLLCINPHYCYLLSCQHEVVLRTQHCSACSSFPGGLHASGQI